MQKRLVDTLPEIEALARAFYKTLDFAHDESHGERVVANAIAIHAHAGGDKDLVVAGAWLHQFHDHLDLLRNRLEPVGLPAPVINELVLIAELSRPHKISASAPLEAQIVFDADALDLIGPLGTVRELLCNFSHRKQSWSETVKNCRAVQDLFAANLQTEAARTLARTTLLANEEFWLQYDDEMRRSSHER